MKRFNMGMWLCLFAIIMMIFGAPGCVSTRNSASMPVLQADGSMIVKGKVRRISVQQGILKIKLPKGDPVVVKFNKETICKNISSVAEIKKYQPLEVIYIVTGGDNIAISVKTIADGSC
jgi:hypothetical protein